MAGENRTEILENGRLLLVFPTDENAIVPIFCPVCSFPMRTLEDSIVFRSHQCCTHCQMRWSGTSLGKWDEGWRPGLSTEGWVEYLIYRKAISRALIIIK